jgi:hypothetical protein
MQRIAVVGNAIGRCQAVGDDRRRVFHSIAIAIAHGNDLPLQRANTEFRILADARNMPRQRRRHDVRRQRQSAAGESGRNLNRCHVSRECHTIRLILVGREPAAIGQHETSAGI